MFNFEGTLELTRRFINGHMYLLKRRLRHLKGISIYNVSLVRDQVKTQVSGALTSIFVVLEDLKGNCIYVSEVQGGSQLGTHFNELPQLLIPTFRVRLKIVGKLPERLLESGSDEVWVVLAEYVLNFSRLNYIPDDNVDVSFAGGVNVPVLHFADGKFTPLKTNYRATREVQTYPAVRAHSFTFNGVLKLNKLLEYSTQLNLELRQLAKEIDSRIGDSSVSYPKEYLMEAKDLMKRNIKLRHDKIQSLKDVRHGYSESTDELQEETRASEEYGANYSEYSNAKHSLKSLKARKMKQLINTMQATGLFEEDGFVVPSSEGSIFSTRLKKLDAHTLIRDECWMTRNTLLGYYLLFVHILAEKIISVPLPHRLSFYGSTSVIENALPLYLRSSPTQQHTMDFTLAVTLFNLDIMQVKQYLERHC